ncbi:hypothetical protein [Sulfoacidibacillus ferrooxidans]|uniref:CCA-adding enzyme n=1 Tax=Sulfoacidibacillus ferrooxidans TaxID=2005001 RepID=A0A9X1V9I9_9BACL|nr:CCA-adding enzyme [Sulfoacidibacillus ferrooxidans]
MTTYYTIPDTNLFQHAKELMYFLHENGCEAYIVGGAVRDLLLNRAIHDVDIATNATPTKLLEIFPDAKKTGIAHGTIAVLSGSYTFEVTTFRSEGPYGDLRHPDFVNFETTLDKDLSRRDFTINAMALDVHGVLYDPYDGLGDLTQRLIRAVGTPSLRFMEDGLRVARAYRIASVLHFSLEQDTANALVQNCEMLGKVSIERRRDEWTKWLDAATETTCKTLPKDMITPWIGRAVDHFCTICPLFSMVIGYLDRLALLVWLSGSSVPFSSTVEPSMDLLFNLRYSRKEIQEVRDLLVIARTCVIGLPDYLPYDWLAIYQRIGYNGLVRAVVLAYAVQDTTARVDVINISKKKVDTLLESSLLLKLQDLAISGYELALACDLQQQEIGHALHLLYDLVSTHIIDNQPSELVAYIRTWKSKG